MKRAGAIIGIAVLVCLYVVTLVFAILSKPGATELFNASLYCTFIIPVLIYVYSMIYKYVHKEKSDTKK
jgi:hypothetical protein